MIAMRCCQSEHIDDIYMWVCAWAYLCFCLPCMKVVDVSGRLRVGWRRFMVRSLCLTVSPPCAAAD